MSVVPSQGAEVGGSLEPRNSRSAWPMTLNKQADHTISYEAERGGHTCDAGIWKAETGEWGVHGQPNYLVSSRVQGQLGLQDSLSEKHKTKHKTNKF